MGKILGFEVDADDNIFTHDWTVNPRDDTSVLTCKVCGAVLYAPTTELLWFYPQGSSIPIDEAFSCDENIMRIALE